MHLILIVISVCFTSLFHAQTANSWDQLIQGVDVYDLDVDSEDNIYIVGKTRDETYFGISDTVLVDYDFYNPFNSSCCTNFLAKLDYLGNLLWFEALEYGNIYEGFITGDDAPVVSLKVDANGDVWLGGNMGERFDLGGVDVNPSDQAVSWWLAKYSSSGAFLFAEYDENDSFLVTTSLRDIALDGDGNLLVLINQIYNASPEQLSYTFFGESFNASILARVSPEGQLIDTHQNSFERHPYSGVWLAYDVLGEAVWNVTTNVDEDWEQSHLLKLDFENEPIQYSLDAHILHAECDAMGNLYLLKRDGSQNIGTLEKYNPNMELQWSYSDPFGHRIRSFGVREDGMVVFHMFSFFEDDLEHDSRIRLLSSNGLPLNTRESFVDITGTVDYGTSYDEILFNDNYAIVYGRMFAQSDLEIYLGYESFSGSGEGSYDAFVSKIHINDIDEVIGVSENAKTNHLQLHRLYPNTYQIVSESAIESIAVFDISGKELSTQVAQPNNMLHFEALPQGLYLVHILTKTKQKMTFKIVR